MQLQIVFLVTHNKLNTNGNTLREEINDGVYFGG